jgi:hypothetical protein
MQPTAIRDRVNLANLYCELGRAAESRAVLADALAGESVTPSALRASYLTTFLQHQPDEMQRERASLERHREFDLLNGLQMAEAAYHGRLRDFRRLRDRALSAGVSRWTSRRAWNSVSGHGGWAIVDALSGLSAAAEREARRTVADAHAPVEVRMDAALALAVAGHARQALQLAADISSAFPRATLWNQLELPTIRANIDLGAGRPQAALEALHPTTPFALAAGSGLLSVYTRGQALLALNAWSDAAAAFRQVVDHPGIEPMSVVHPLAHLGLARALAGSGDPTARQQYENFLALWKNADPDIPILRIARAEYERLDGAKRPPSPGAR